MRTARLNIFQRTQRLWDTLHPYNAAQAMELAEAFSPGAIEAAFHSAITDLGLGTFVVSGGSYHIEPNAPHVELIQSKLPLPQLIAGQMNLPFDRERSFPFRPFVSECEGVQTIGVIYQHWPADSVSIRMVMRQWLLRLIGRPAHATRLALPAGGLAHYYGAAAAQWSVLQQVCDIVGFSSRIRRMRRVRSTSPCGQVDVQLRNFAPGLVHELRHRARRDGCTVGDVFLAAMAEAVSLHGPNEPSAHRPDVALGTIVDLRGRSDRVPANVFGLFLGFTTSAFAHDDLDRFDALLRAARRQRRTAIARKSAEASQLNMAIGLGIGKWLGGGEALRVFYRKRFALSGGISNVNLSGEWPGDFYPDVLRAYHRTSPTGPMMPLVLTPTTLGDRLNVCCTFRTAITDPTSAGRVLDAFEARLTQYAS